MDNVHGSKVLEIRKYKNKQFYQQEDLLAIEAPLEIQLVRFVDGEWVNKSISITMRTPGNDEALAVGFLMTEGIIHESSQVEDVAIPSENIVVVQLTQSTAVDIDKLDRNFYTTSSCGVCGKTSIDLVKTKIPFDLSLFSLNIPFEKLLNLQDQLLGEQSLFSQTGGIHAAALFDENLILQDVQEDVGRHNALDKLIGGAFMKKNVPLKNHLLLVSGRASFELVQKAAMAGIPMMVAIGAPSTLAVELAEEAGMKLVGFLKKTGFNVYC